MSTGGSTTAAGKGMELLSKRQVRPFRVASLTADLDRRKNGLVYLRSPKPLGSYPERVTDRLEHWAAQAPDRIFLAQRDARGEWQTTNYSQTLTRVRRLARGLLDHGLSQEKPLMILSGNSIEHGLLALAAMYAGIPYAPIAPTYSLAVKEFHALAHLWKNFTPALVFAEDGAKFEPALRFVLAGRNTRVLVLRSRPKSVACLSLE